MMNEDPDRNIYTVKADASVLNGMLQDSHIKVEEVKSKNRHKYTFTFSPVDQ